MWGAEDHLATSVLGREKSSILQSLCHSIEMVAGFRRCPCDVEAHNPGTLSGVGVDHIR